jgi:hypothetical protein
MSSPWLSGSASYLLLLDEVNALSIFGQFFTAQLYIHGKSFVVFTSLKQDFGSLLFLFFQLAGNINLCLACHSRPRAFMQLTWGTVALW